MGYGTTGIAIKDSLTLTASWGPSTLPKVEDMEGKSVITCLRVNDLPDICLGDLVKVQKAPYRVNIITECSLPGGFRNYELSIALRTKSTLMLLPMLPGHKSRYMTQTSLLNCFMGTPDNPRCIALLYRFSGNKDFLMLERDLQQFKGFISMTEPCKSTVLFTFDVPEEHSDDYDLFCMGKYSRMSDRYRERILRFHDVGPSSTLGQILNRSEDRRRALEERLEVRIPEGAEVFSVPDPSKEVFNPDIYQL